MPEPTESRRPLRELATLALRPTRAHLLVAVILLVCGLVVTLQIRARSTEQDYSGLRRTELIALLDDLTAESRRLEAEIATLERTQEQLRSGADRQQVARAEAERRRAELSILSGTSPATGEGIRVVISDPDAMVGEGVLLNTLEELRDAGAEVIEVNDQVRVVASSWVASQDDELVLDGTPITRPILLEVIGEPHALAEALRFRGGLVSEISDRGGEVSIVSDPAIVISSLHSPVEPRFARPA